MSSRDWRADLDSPKQRVTTVSLKSAVTAKSAIPWRVIFEAKIWRRTVRKYLRNEGLLNASFYLKYHPEIHAGNVDTVVRFLRTVLKDGRPEPPPDLPDPVQKRSLTLQSLCNALQDKPGVLLWRESGEDIEAPPLKVMGQGPTFDREEPFRSLDRYVVKLQNAAIIGGTRYVLVGDQSIYHDEIANNLDDESVAIKHRKSKRLSEHCVSTEVDGRYENRIKRGIHLMCEHDYNYFHFVIEVLPRLILLEQVREADDCPLLISGGLHPNLRQLLALADKSGRPTRQLRRDVVHTVDCLYHPSDVSQVLDVYTRPMRAEETRIPAEILRRVRERILDRLGFVTQTAHRYIYVRRGRGLRQLVNEDAVESALADLGFEILTVNGLSVETQIKIFRGAKVIVAPTGAAVTNILWCQPGTKVVVLASDNPFSQLRIWQQLARVSDVHIQCLLGPRTGNIDELPEVHDDYEIPIDLLLREVKDVLGADLNAQSQNSTR